MLDFKSPLIRNWRDFFLDDLSHRGGGRCIGPQCGDEFVQLPRGSLCLDYYAGGVVPHQTANLHLFGQSVDKRPKAHTLHTTGDVETTPDHGINRSCRKDRVFVQRALHRL